MCKIVPVTRKGNTGISFSILANPGWHCTTHQIYFGTNFPEDRPKKCPMFQNTSKRKKRSK